MDAPVTSSAQVGSGCLAVYADITCPWATVLLHRLRRAREQAGADVVLDIRTFALEIINEAPTPYGPFGPAMEIAAELEPDYGFHPWSAPEHTFPVTSLPALEAVRASYAMSATAAEQLDAALRRAFFVDHRCISLMTVILDCARECDEVDEDHLEQVLRSGQARADVFEHVDAAQSNGVEGSPHVFLADGSDVFSPAVTLSEDDGTVRVAEDDPSAVDDLIARALQTKQAD